MTVQWNAGAVVLRELKEQSANGLVEIENLITKINALNEPKQIRHNRSDHKAYVEQLERSCMPDLMQQIIDAIDITFNQFETTFTWINTETSLVNGGFQVHFTETKYYLCMVENEDAAVLPFLRKHYFRLMDMAFALQTCIDQYLSIIDQVLIKYGRYDHFKLKCQNLKKRCQKFKDDIKQYIEKMEKRGLDGFEKPLDQVRREHEEYQAKIKEREMNACMNQQTSKQRKKSKNAKEDDGDSSSKAYNLNFCTNLCLKGRKKVAEQNLALFENSME